MAMALRGRPPGRHSVMVGPGLYVGDVAEYRGDAVLERVGGLQFLIGPVQPFGYRPALDQFALRQVTRSVETSSH